MGGIVMVMRVGNAIWYNGLEYINMKVFGIYYINIYTLGAGIYYKQVHVINILFFRNNILLLVYIMFTAIHTHPPRTKLLLIVLFRTVNLI